MPLLDMISIILQHELIIHPNVYILITIRIKMKELSLFTHVGKNRICEEQDILEFKECICVNFVSTIISSLHNEHSNTLES